jgi:signal transduction histidine kinase
VEDPGDSSSERYATFIDISSTVAELQSLQLSFAVIAVMVLLAFFLISLLFANRSIRPIRSAWEQQKQFLADASHELKTPLAVMTANFDAVLSDPESTVEEQMKWLNNLGAGMDRMSALVTKLLLLDKADAETYDVVLEPFDVRLLVEEELAGFDALAAQSAITVSIEIDESVPAEVKSDHVLVRQIFDTLVDNAFKYTPREGWIAIAAKQTERGSVVSVTNSGPGIEAEDLAHVFDRFYRSNKARSGETAGFGLGLSIARKLAETLGATLMAESVVNEYTRFTLQF